MVKRTLGLSLSLSLALTLTLAPAPAARADEGMWLFNNPPRELLQKRFGFSPSDEWLEHVQKASVRFNSGGSGSFVSPDGLVMTNHHVAADALQKLSTKEHDYLKEGFHARSRDQELKCVDLELNVLMSIEVVTDRVNAAVKPEMSPEEAFAARRKVIAEIEKESLDKTGLRSNVITLYQGAEYHLYRFKRYTDIRLVFAPEQQAAFFGGDPDNFEYPRWCMDVAFFRVYEDGKPAKTPHYLKWSKAGAKEGELVFVTGHPGRTSRLNTVAELEYLRDVGFPFLMERLYRMEVNLSVFASESPEHERRAKDELFGIQNSRKARSGGLAGLLDPSIMRRKAGEEKKLRAAVESKPELKEARGAWETIAELQKKRAEIIRPYTMLEGEAGFNTIYFDIARTLLRAAEEKPKPNGERLREFQDSNLPSLEQQLFSEQPIYEDLETTKLADALTHLCAVLGYENELVQKVLAGKSPRERAAELVNGTKVGEVAVRKKLYEGGKEALAQFGDPMIELARLVDDESRRLRKVYDTEIDEVK
ncbi:MAG TPA: S46 family peptidase, partial [Gemmataceae bacterium]